MHERLLCVALRSRNTVSLYTRGHRPPPPPFARLPPPKNRLHEDIELVWNDGVAPETFIDFEASHIGKYQALAHWLLAFSGLASIMGIVALYDPESMRQAVRKVEMLRINDDALYFHLGIPKKLLARLTMGIGSN